MSKDTLQFQKARFVRAFFALGALALLCSCHGLSSRMDTTEGIVLAGGLETDVLETSFFPLFSAHNSIENGGILTVIIEGDGYAWIDRHTVSDNPTPVNPVGLRILSSLHRPAVYLARPCQYRLTPACTPALWSYNRFSPEVMGSYMEALDHLASVYKTEQFDLIGFSGGAYIALFLAASRQDIHHVTTVAGVVDPENWTTFHDISPLRLHKDMDQLLRSSSASFFEHLCSTDDNIVPCEILEHFIARAQSLGLDNHKLRMFEKETHETLWTKLTPE